MGYWYLVVAILSEVVATSALNASQGFTRLWPSMVTVVGYCLAFYFLSLTLRTVPMGIAYAVWAGLGTASVALIGWLFLKEPMTAVKAVLLLMIIGGVVGLKTISTES